jgi:D-amino peptidase
MTERALLVPGVELKDGCTLRYAAPDYPTAYQVIQLITVLGNV